MSLAFLVHIEFLKFGFNMRDKILSAMIWLR
jgi:hypothetical protein